jgi:hypothetical protein
MASFPKIITSFTGSGLAARDSEKVKKRMDRIRLMALGLVREDCLF